MWFSRFSVNLSCFALSFWLSFQSPAQRKGQKICNYFPTAADTRGLYEVHLIKHHVWIKDIQTVPIWLDWLDELISQEKKPQAQFLSTERGSHRHDSACHTFKKIIRSDKASTRVNISKGTTQGLSALMSCPNFNLKILPKIRIKNR